MTPDDTNMTPPVPALPPEVREFLEACASAEDRSNLDGDGAETVLAQINEQADELLAKYSPPRPAPVTADDIATQQQAYAWQAVWNKLASLPEFGAVWEAKETGCAHALRTVDALLARAEAAERDRDQLRAEIVRLEKNLYTGDDDEKQALRAEVERLQDVAINGAGAKVLKDLRTQLAAAEAKLAEAVRERDHFLALAKVTVDARELAEKVVTRIEGTFRDWLMAGERTKAIEEVAAVLAPVVARLNQAELDLGALHGRIGVFAAKWFCVWENLPTDETFRQMEVEIVDAANKYVAAIARAEAAERERSQLRAAIDAARREGGAK